MTNRNPLEPPRDAAQLDFWDEDIHLPSSKQMFRVDEVAKLLEISNNQVRNLCESGAMESVPINTTLEPVPERVHIRITRRSVEAFINTRRRSLC